MREYTKFYINGQWVDPVAPKTLEVLDPSTEAACATISLGSEEDVNLAVAAAKAAFESFRPTTAEERAEMQARLKQGGFIKAMNLVDGDLTKQKSRKKGK